MDSTREAYQQKIEAQLELWGAEITRLKARSRILEADARIKSQKRLKDLEKRYNVAARQFGRLKKAGDSKWGEMRVIVGVAVDRIREAVEEWNTRVV